MRALTLLAVVCGLALGGAACLAHNDPPAKGADRHMALVADKPCPEVYADIRQRLTQDPALGLASETQVDGGVDWELPWRTQGGLRWKAVVMARCVQPAMTRLEVQATALAGDKASPAAEADVRAIERRVLKALGPRGGGF